MIETLKEYCEEKNLKVAKSESSAKVLQDSIEKGFPKDNHLIITTENVDKRKTLYKAIKKHGVIFDCSVPKGDRKADKAEQDLVIRQSMDTILKKAKKTIEPAAVNALRNLTGFDLRTLAGNLEKLIDFTQDRKKIVLDDVNKVLKRTKTDPIYELTGAISDRNLQQALFYTSSLLANNFHPLQILAALTNQVRKLIISKDFLQSSFGKN